MNQEVLPSSKYSQSLEKDSNPNIFNSSKRIRTWVPGSAESRSFAIVQIVSTPRKGFESKYSQLLEKDLNLGEGNANNAIGGQDHRGRILRRFHRKFQITQKIPESTENSRWFTENSGPSEWLIFDR